MKGSFRSLARVWIAFALCCPGGLLLAPPAFHAAERVASAVQAKKIWKQWKLSRPEDRDREGRPAFWLDVPDCGITTLVLEGVTADALGRFPCAMPRSLRADPIVILAHRDTHFRNLGTLREGGAITLETPEASRAHYLVADLLVLKPEELSARIAALTQSGDLFLVTCYPFRHVGPAPLRFLVHARLIVD